MEIFLQIRNESEWFFLKIFCIFLESLKVLALQLLLYIYDRNFSLMITREIEQHSIIFDVYKTHFVKDYWR